MEKIMKNIFSKRNILCAILGVGVGLIGGLLGSGGGILLIFCLPLLHKVGKRKEPCHTNDKNDKKDIFAQTIAIILPMTMFSVWMYSREGGVEWSGSLVYVIPGALGGLVGAYFLEKFKPGWVNKIFAVIVIVAGGILVVR